MSKTVERNVQMHQITLDRISHYRDSPVVDPYFIYKEYSAFARIRYISYQPRGFLVAMSMSASDLAAAEIRLKLSELAKYYNFVFCDAPPPRKYETDLCRSTAQLSMQSEQEPAFSIFDTLHDDCLEPLFESPAMSANDLLSIAYTCKRFYPIAKKAFRTKEIDSELIGNMQLWQAELFFRTFGEEVRFINLLDLENVPNDIVVRIALQQCAKIVNFGCKVRYLSTIQAIQPRVADFDELSIDCFSNRVHPMEILFKPSYEYRLKKLNFRYNILVLPHMKLPHLKEVSLIQKDLRLQMVLLDFFRLNSQITKFELKGLNSPTGIHSIILLLPNLEELIIETTFDRTIIANCACFGKLKQLKCLKIYGVNVVPILDELYKGDVPLRRLSVTTMLNANGLVGAICKFKSLKQLQINRISYGRLMCIVEHLTHLEEIHIKLCNTLHTIRDVLRTGQQLKRAHFGISTDRDSVFEVELLFMLMDKHLLHEIDTIKKVKCVELVVEVLIRTSSTPDKILDDKQPFHIKWAKLPRFAISPFHHGYA